MALPHWAHRGGAGGSSLLLLMKKSGPQRSGCRGPVDRQPHSADVPRPSHRGFLDAFPWFLQPLGRPRRGRCGVRPRVCPRIKGRTETARLPASGHSGLPPSRQCVACRTEQTREDLNPANQHVPRCFIEEKPRLCRIPVGTSWQPGRTPCHTGGSCERGHLVVSEDAHCANRFLARLCESDQQTLFPCLGIVDLAQKTTLHDVGQPYKAAYFPHDGIISLVVNLSTGDMVEAGTVGRDGVAGAAAAFTGALPVNRAVVQIGGRASAISVDDLCAVIHRSPGLRDRITLYQDFLLAQAQQCAACNATHPV